MRNKERLKIILNENNFFSSLFFLLFSTFFLSKDTRFYFFEKHYYHSTLSSRFSSLKSSSNNNNTLSSSELSYSDKKGEKERKEERKEEEIIIDFNLNKLIELNSSNDSLNNENNENDHQSNHEKKNQRKGDSFLERKYKEDKKEIYFFLKNLYQKIEIENTFLIVYNEREEIYSTNLDAFLVILENSFFFSYFSFFLRKIFSFSSFLKINFEKFLVLINNFPFHFSVFTTPSPSLSSQNRGRGEEKTKSREYMKEREKKERVWLESKLLTKHLFSNILLFLLLFYVFLMNVDTTGTHVLPSSIRAIGLVTGKSYFLFLIIMIKYHQMKC